MVMCGSAVLLSLVAAARVGAVVGLTVTLRLFAEVSVEFASAVVFATVEAIMLVLERAVWVLSALRAVVPVPEVAMV